MQKISHRESNPLSQGALGVSPLSPDRAARMRLRATPLGQE